MNFTTENLEAVGAEEGTLIILYRRRLPVNTAHITAGGDAQTDQGQRGYNGRWVPNQGDATFELLE